MRRRVHRFPLRIYLVTLGTFIVLFGAEFALDLTAAAHSIGRSPLEVFPEIEGSWYSAVQAGACLARAGYCMLSICLSLFFLTIPLAANFYTPKLIEVYLRDRVNLLVFAVGVFAAANTHFQTTIVWEKVRGAVAALAGPSFPGFTPAITLAFNMWVLAAAWALILPYALYTYRFMSPEVLHEHLEGALRADFLRATRTTARHKVLAARIRRSILDLANMTFKAIDRCDRDLALDGIRRLGDVYLYYLDWKPLLPRSWFEPEREWFQGLSHEAFELIEEESTWVGHLLLHQVVLAFNQALARTPDLAGAIAAVAFRIAAEASRRGDRALLALGLRVGNSLIREAVKRGGAGVVQDVVRSHRELLLVVARTGGIRAPVTISEAASHLAYYHAAAHALGAHDCADTIALSLARLIEMTAALAPRALGPSLEAFERLEDPCGGGGRHLVKARAIVASCLGDAGRGAERSRVLAMLGRASAEERDEVRAALEASAVRSEAGREVFGAEPCLEFLPEPRRSRVIATLAALG